MKNNRGAISIEMIITVIVIMLLVGVTIFMLTGENGLFVPKDNENAVNELKEQNVTDNQNTVTNNDEQNQNMLITVPVE